MSTNAALMVLDLAARTRFFRHGRSVAPSGCACTASIVGQPNEPTRRCPKSLRLRRLMCGRPLAFRQVSPLEFGLRPVGAQPRIHYEKQDGSAERFCTSVGIAES